MASLSSGFEGLNLGAAQHDGGDRAEVPTAAEENLGAIPKRVSKKKSERSKNRNRKSDLASFATENPTEHVSKVCDPLTDIPETLNPFPQQDGLEVKVEGSSPGGKKTSTQKRSRRGKRQLKATQAESDDVGDKAIDTIDEDKENNVDDDDDDDSSIRFGTDPVPYAWKNVTKNGWIKKCVLVDGKPEFGRPQAGDAVLVKTQGKLRNGTIVDDNPTFVFNVGEHEVIEGLDLAVRSMYKNELSIVSIKPELAYGSIGRSRTTNGKLEEIPGNERITYLMGLLHFEKSRDRSTLTWAQRRKCGQSKMRLANWWFQRKEYSVSIKCYKKALTYYNDVPPNHECSNAAEYKELMLLLEERLRVMRQVANIFKRIANLIQSGQITI